MIIKWMVVNLIFLIGVFVWGMRGDEVSIIIIISKTLAQVALTLFWLNINMYFLFLIVRKNKKKDMKITLAKFARKIMKIHIPIAVMATTLIIVHGYIMLNKHTFLMTNYKMISGILASMVLLILLMSGIMRKLKSSGFRRRFHLSMVFIFFAIIHISV